MFASALMVCWISDFVHRFSAKTTGSTRRCRRRSQTLCRKSFILHCVCVCGIQNVAYIGSATQDITPPQNTCIQAYTHTRSPDLDKHGREQDGWQKTRLTILPATHTHQQSPACSKHNILYDVVSARQTHTHIHRSALLDIAYAYLLCICMLQFQLCRCSARQTFMSSGRSIKYAISVQVGKLAERLGWECLRCVRAPVLTKWSDKNITICNNTVRSDNNNNMLF